MEAIFVTKIAIRGCNSMEDPVSKKETCFTTLSLCCRLETYIGSKTGSNCCWSHT